MCSADSWGIGGRDVGSKDEMPNFALLIRIALPEVIDGVVSLHLTLLHFLHFTSSRKFVNIIWLLIFASFAGPGSGFGTHHRPPERLFYLEKIESVHGANFVWDKMSLKMKIIYSMNVISMKLIGKSRCENYPPAC